LVGFFDGERVGLKEGLKEGFSEGFFEGLNVGRFEGTGTGRALACNKRRAYMTTMYTGSMMYALIRLVALPMILTGKKPRMPWDGGTGY
jgi:hypothetical protein